jgi:hypothetical protein
LGERGARIFGRNFVLTPAANADLVEGDWNFTYGIQLGDGF